MQKLFTTFFISITCIVPAFSQISVNKTIDQAHVIRLMDHLLTQVEDAIYEIDPSVDRIAIYNVKLDRQLMDANLGNWIDGRLHSIFQKMDNMTLVTLPRLNGIKISSSDSMFQILNTTPSLEDLWRVGKKLRIKAFIEGECSYNPGLGMIMNLRLSRTGSGNIVWTKTFKVYEKDIREDKIEMPTIINLNLGLEAFQINYTENPVINKSFNGILTYHTIDLGIIQYLESKHRFRYEIRTGLAFLANGIKLSNDHFSKDTFYGEKGRSTKIQSPVSFRFHTLFYIGLINKQKSLSGDWLSLYFALSRHFVKRAPDFNCIGIGLRSDISPNFSLSSGISFAMGTKFSSIPMANSDSMLELNFNSLQYHLLLIQYSF